MYREGNAGGNLSPRSASDSPPHSWDTFSSGYRCRENCDAPEDERATLGEIWEAQEFARCFIMDELAGLFANSIITVSCAVLII